MKNIVFFFLFCVVQVAQAMNIQGGDSPPYACIPMYPNGSRLLSADAIETWSPRIWGFEGENQKIWSPDYAGLKIEENGDVVVRFQFSRSDIQFMSRLFDNAHGRVPFAIEIDVIDSDNVLGRRGIVDYHVRTSQSLGNPDDIDIFVDTPSMDSVHQMSVVIAHPERIASNTLHEIVFRPNHVGASSGKFHFVFQLSVNYKWIAAMEKGYSQTCDFLDLVERISTLGSYGGFSIVNIGSYGSGIPDEAKNGWYYYLAAKSDISNGNNVNGGNTQFGNTSVCWDDEQNLSHSDSGSNYCHSEDNLKNLFTAPLGEDYAQSSDNGSGSSNTIETGGIVPGPGPGIEIPPTDVPIALPPDFIVRKTWLVTPWGDEVYQFGLQESFDTKAQSENIGDGPCNPEDPIQTITGHFYLSRGYKEDVHSGDGAWRRIDSTITQCDNLQPEETHTETKNTVISEWITEPGMYNIVYCIDHPQDDHNNGGEHLEKHESNNCSTEAVFEVTANAIENQDPRFVDFVTSGMQFRGTSPYYAGDQARFGATITNRGNVSSPSDIRSSYSVQCPGTSRLYLADDGTMASTLSAGASAFEENVGPVTLPNVAGTCTAYFCADYQNAVAESDEGNNCTSFSFVLQPRPAPRLVITKFQDETGCCTTNTGSRIKPDIWVRNDGPIAPASDVTVTYHISSPVATGGAWWHIGYGVIRPSELPPGGTDEDYMDGNGYPIPQNSAWKLQWHTIRGCLKADGSAPVGDPATEVCAYYTRYSKK